MLWLRSCLIRTTESAVDQAKNIRRDSAIDGCLPEVSTGQRIGRVQNGRKQDLAELARTNRKQSTLRANQDISLQQGQGRARYQPSPLSVAHNQSHPPAQQKSKEEDRHSAENQREEVRG